MFMYNTMISTLVPSAHVVDNQPKKVCTLIQLDIALECIACTQCAALTMYASPNKHNTQGLKRSTCMHTCMANKVACLVTGTYIDECCLGSRLWRCVLSFNTELYCTAYNWLYSKYTIDQSHFAQRQLTFNNMFTTCRPELIFL